MLDSPLLLLSAIGLLGAAAQWFAWWVKLPAILFLLLIGLWLGPVAGILNPDELFGDLLFPVVSLAVAIILFEGSLTLHFSEIRGLESVVRNMLSVGVMSTWVGIAVATHYLMGFSWSLAFLFGALVVVTGPTVIVPMLRTVRPNARISNILRWEGIVIDPLGALLAVLVFDFIVAGQEGHAGLGHIFLTFGQIVAVGVLVGAAAGYVFGLVLRHHWLPEYLHNYVALALVFSVFTAANMMQEEAGLLAVTVMGIWLANMKSISIEEILNFKESLSLLLISGLFIMLAARLDGAQLLAMGWPAVAVFLVIQFVVRPLKIIISTWGSDLRWQERALLAWIAPRGIVAAAVSALFAIKLEQAGVAQAEWLVSLTFLVILGTVVLQSSTAGWLARRLGVAEPAPRGVLIVGANQLARAVAKALREAGYRVLLTDTHWPYVQKARQAGLQTFYGSAISEQADRQLDLVGLGMMFGLSQDDHLNLLAMQRYAREFSKQAVFALPVSGDSAAGSRNTVSSVYRGNRLFNEPWTYHSLATKVASGWQLQTLVLDESLSMDELQEKWGEKVIPLFVLTPSGRLKVFGGEAFTPKAEWTLMALFEPEVDPLEAPASETQ
ncbi:MAG: cation:proton antiporter [bacterium]